MQNNPECNLLGTAAQIIDEEKIVKRFLYPPTQDIDCKFQLLFKNCFIHTSVMIRKSVFKSVGLYSVNSDRKFAEDYDLWSRISRISVVSNLSDILVYYRQHSDGLSKQNNFKFNSCVINICAQNICLALNLDLNDPTANSFASILYGPPFRFQGLPNFVRIDSLIFKLSKLFKSSQNYLSISREAFIRCLMYRLYWLLKCTFLRYILTLFVNKSHLSFWHVLKDKYIFPKFK